MKLIIMIIIYSLITVSCAPTLLHPPFEDSNQRFIEKTIKKLDLGKEIEDKVNLTDRIAVLSIEDYKPGHKALIAMIEDQIILSLINKGYTILERDKQAIEKLIREGNEKYSLTFNKPTEIISYNNITHTNGIYCRSM